MTISPVRSIPVPSTTSLAPSIQEAQLAIDGDELPAIGDAILRFFDFRRYACRRRCRCAATGEIVRGDESRIDGGRREDLIGRIRNGRSCLFLTGDAGPVILCQWASSTLCPRRRFYTRSIALEFDFGSPPPRPADEDA